MIRIPRGVTLAICWAFGCRWREYFLRVTYGDTRTLGPFVACSRCGRTEPRR